MNPPATPKLNLSFATWQAIGDAAIFIVKIIAAVYIIRALGGLC